jgi:hypothetical protein
VNVGDDKVTTNDDLREFRQLDTEASEKQFILLVNSNPAVWAAFSRGWRVGQFGRL